MASNPKELRVEPLDAKKHDRASFSCGVESLDAYLTTQASQDVRRKANAVFVLVALDEPRAVLGYFTLCAYGLAPGAVPDEARKHLPRYPLVSATLIGRLAIAKSHHGRGFGSALLVRALRKAYESADIVGSSMVVVDANDEGAANFYAAHGFVRLPDSLRLVLPMQTVGKLFASGPGVSKPRQKRRLLRVDGERIIRIGGHGGIRVRARRYARRAACNRCRGVG